MTRIVPFLRLMRPANIVTAVADILAGISVSGILLSEHASVWKLLLLVLSTIGLYGGGVVFNDVFDADLDKKERPERPIPRGQVSRKEATILGLGLFVMSVSAAFLVSPLSGIIAVCIALLASVYDRWAKHYVIWGPMAMGSCRALNLLLGISASPEAVQYYWPFTIIPLVFIAAITLLSQGEVHGASKVNIVLSGALFFLVFSLLNTLPASVGKEVTWSLPLSVLFLVFVMRPYLKAFRSGEAQDIRKAVKAGVLSLILLDATLVAAFSGIFAGLLLVLLLPLSFLLAKTFAVT